MAERSLDEHFSLQNFSIHRQSEEEEELALGFHFSDAELIGLCGAPTGSKVRATVLWEPQKDICFVNNVEKVEVIPPGILLQVENDQYIDEVNEVILTVDEISPKIYAHVIYIKRVDFRSGTDKRLSFAGIGAFMLARIVRSAREIGTFTSLKLEAAGGRLWQNRDEGGRWYGYVAWPRYGFDMPLHAYTQRIIPEFPFQPVGLSSCERVSDVLGLGKDGEAFWKAAGDGWNMDFPLKSASSLRTLSDFLNFEV